MCIKTLSVTDIYNYEYMVYIFILEIPSYIFYYLFVVVVV